MERWTIVIFLIIVLISLSACAPEVDLELPKSETVISVDLTDGEKTAIVTDSAWIYTVLDLLDESRPTIKQSVQDVPQVKPYYKLEFQELEKTTTVYVYKANGFCYVEVPYSWIYKNEYGEALFRAFGEIS